MPFSTAVRISVVLGVLMGSQVLAEPSSASQPTHNKPLPFGQPRDQVQLRLEQQCAEITIHENLPLEVPTAKVSQTQIDCIDYRPMQHQGTSEWIFADGELDIVWVLSPLETLEAVKADLAQRNVLPEYSLPGMADFYLDRGFGLRFQPTEFLYFSDRLKPYYQAWLESM
jgi:hypothetical protein